jgi:hypothetical protein
MKPSIETYEKWVEELKYSNEALQNELIKKDAQLLKKDLELTEAKHLLNGVIRAIEVEEALSL